jgi:CHAD domain-containing protein
MAMDSTNARSEQGSPGKHAARAKSSPKQAAQASSDQSQTRPQTAETPSRARRARQRQSKAQQAIAQSSSPAQPSDSSPNSLLKNRPESVGDYAYRILQKNVKKVMKYEQAVLEDTDPEPLHQMRVGMRRLRSALHVVEGAVVLPKPAGDRPIKKLARRLGDLRDLDVLIDKLQTQYRPKVRGKARTALDEVIQALQQQRSQRFAAVQKTLQGKRYNAFKIAYADWLAQPEYGAIAAYPIQDLLPDLLAPGISQLFLHPGWLCCTTAPQVPLVPISLPAGALYEQLGQDGEILHDLRKQIKRVRYQAEFWVEECPALEPFIKDFKAIQDLLGQLQDCAVLRTTLKTYAGKHWDARMGAIARLIQTDETAAWQAWQPYQQRYLDPAHRHQLRRATSTENPLS